MNCMVTLRSWHASDRIRSMRSYGRRSGVCWLACCGLFAVPLVCLSQTTPLPERYAREEDYHASVLIGYNGWENHAVEVGVAYNMIGITGNHPIGRAYAVSVELQPWGNGSVGPKTTGWLAGGSAAVAIGASFIWYFGAGGHSVRLRPEFGVGSGSFRAAYGYSIPLYNADMEGINTHNLSLAVLLSLRKLRTERR